MAAKRQKNPGLDRRLWAAAAACNGAEVRRLLDAGANPNASHSRIPALRAAVSMGNTRETRYEDGREVVVEYHPRETVEALLAAGADADKADAGGMTPLMGAFYSPDAVRLLLPHVKDVDAVTNDGFTALFLAALNGVEEVVRLLLDAGASPNPVNSRGQSAFDAASATPTIQKLLADAGGKPAKELEAGQAAMAKAAAANRRREARERKLDEKWPRPDLTEAGDSQAYAAAKALLRSLCPGVEPHVQGEAGECVSYLMPRSRAVALVDEHHAGFLAQGAYLFASGDALQPGEDDRVTLLPTTSVYDVIQYVGTNRNDGAGPAAVCEGLARLGESVTFTITRVTFDRLEGRWGKISDVDRLARELERFCPDIVHQGVGTVRALADHLRKSGRLYLWWD
jgi:hypothetical protein